MLTASRYPLQHSGFHLLHRRTTLRSFGDVAVDADGPDGEPVPETTIERIARTLERTLRPD